MTTGTVKLFKIVGLIAGLIVVISSVAFALYRGSVEPQCQGRPLSYWFNELPDTFVTYAGVSFPSVKLKGNLPGESPRTSFAAIRGIGTNGLPFILQKLNPNESPIEKIVVQISMHRINRTLYAYSLSDDPIVERGQAVTALLILSPLPASVISQLRQMTNATGPIARSAEFVIEANTTPQPPSVLARFE